MKAPVIKRLLPLALALCLTCGSSMGTFAAETKSAETTQTEEQTAGEAEAQENDAASTPAVQDTASGSGSTSGGTTTEKPNTDIKVTPSNANALLLMDAGAQSPKAVP